MKTIYISGPISGIPDKNKGNFDYVADIWRQRGWKVVSALDIQHILNPTWQECMQDDIKVLMTCDAIAMLFDWQKSSGATIELLIAQALNLEIYDGALIGPIINSGCILKDQTITRFPNVLASVSSYDTILDEAKALVHGVRQDAYDHPTKNFQRIADMWSPVLGVQVTPKQVGLCMIGMKIAREIHKPTRDSLVDICGYAECISMLDEAKPNA